MVTKFVLCQCGELEVACKQYVEPKRTSPIRRWLTKITLEQSRPTVVRHELTIRLIEIRVTDRERLEAARINWAGEVFQRRGLRRLCACTVNVQRNRYIGSLRTEERCRSIALQDVVPVTRIGVTGLERRCATHVGHHLVQVCPIGKYVQTHGLSLNERALQIQLHTPGVQ